MSFQNLDENAWKIEFDRRLGELLSASNTIDLRAALYILMNDALGMVVEVQEIPKEIETCSLLTETLID